MLNSSNMSSNSASSFSDTASPESMSASSPVDNFAIELSAPVPTAGRGTPSSVASTTTAPATLPPVFAKNSFFDHYAAREFI